MSEKKIWDYAADLVVGAHKTLNMVVSWQVFKSLEEGHSLALQHMDRTFREMFWNILLNIVLITASVFAFPRFLDPYSATLWITQVYLGSVLYGFIRFLYNFGEIFGFLKYLLKYRLDALHYWIASKIEPDVHQAYKSMAMWKKMVSILGGGPSRQQYIALQTNIILHAIFKKMMASFVMLLLYVVIFRFMIAPKLIENMTGLNLMQASLLPLSVSADYYFGTHWEAWILAFK
ncbi:MAG: hypothetical protein HQM12_21695 [SAR324 cluster bacterium]|nr:hypothetical protein [SAR324 cluster bacterium]